jgi:glycerophosphoryl diester phosphodiesterase
MKLGYPSLCVTVTSLGLALALGCGAARRAGPGSGSGADQWAPSAWRTLDGSPPLVIGHRGFPGRAPEETRPSYEWAAAMGADALEEDLHLSRDCVLMARHNPWLSDNTNVRDVAATHPEVAARRRTSPGVLVPVAWPATGTSGPSTYLVDRIDPWDPGSALRALVVDGEDHVGDWSITDFTASELQAWLGGTTFDAADERPQDLNGRYPILRFEEILDIARDASLETGRVIAVYPETKNPTWNNEQAIANGCGVPGSHPLEDALLRILEDNQLNTPDAPVFVQSFEPSSLRYLRSAGLKTRVVQLIDASDVDYRTGTVRYDEITAGRPYDWTVGGDPRWFDALLTPEGLAEIKTYADGIGPWKPQIVPLLISPYPEHGPGGGPFVPATNLATTQPPTTLIEDAHRAGLFVHAFTFRDEARYLAADEQGDPMAEYLRFFALGVDGVFSDFADTAVAARDAYAEQLR